MVPICAFMECAKPSASPSGLTSEAGNYKDCLNLCGYAGKTAEGSGSYGTEGRARSFLRFADSSSLNTEQKGSWDSENFWLDPSAKGQLETSEEEDGLRKSLDRFYEAFAHPLPGSGDQLSAPVCRCLSQAISELEGQESQKYTLRSFQMARVIFNRDGCSILQRHSRETRFYPLEQGANSLEGEEPTPGLSREIVHFLLEQNIMKDS
ncbi:shieldin complex subunit 1 [Microtus ochrogaster]|uniref:Shieldin complex subunit 1 n=1 Tax=Microtus ochrogaster TaxID=79684 RepID=A0ABM0LGL9_MICOH|nr:shieldin complex subunit 1 [Microtus ochrogaster]